MPNRFHLFSKGEYYHIYNRGVNREAIFFSPRNYEYCQRLVKKYVKMYEISVIAYCLMPNHYHFLLRQDSEQTISQFINVLFNAYVQAVNKQQRRKGTLFEGRFCHIHIDQSSYLVHLCRYIHINPKKAGLVEKIEDWPYSNYPEWIGLRQAGLVDLQFIQDQRFTPESYIEFVNDELGAEEARKKIQRYLWE